MFLGRGSISSSLLLKVGLTNGRRWFETGLRLLRISSRQGLGCSRRQCRPIEVQEPKYTCPWGHDL